MDLAIAVALGLSRTRYALAAATPLRSPTVLSQYPHDSVFYIEVVPLQPESFGDAQTAANEQLGERAIARRAGLEIQRYLLRAQVIHLMVAFGQGAHARGGVAYEVAALNRPGQDSAEDLQRVVGRLGCKLSLVVKIDEPVLDPSGGEIVEP